MIKLRRVTSSQDYLPFIDGLRFYTLLTVVLVHFVDFYQEHTYPVRQAGFYQELHIESLFGFSDNGILVFFAISGFILGLPFAKSIFNGKPFPNLKSFYLRRITRLEPPYLLLLTLLLLLNVFIIHRDTLANTLPHYFASFFYLHNIVYEAHPTLNFVFWTLEIEVQFYLIAPLLAWLVFRQPKLTRRIIIIAVILLFSLLNASYPSPFKSLYNYIQYFFCGFLAVDLYLNNSFKKHAAFDLVCITLAFLMYTGVVKYGPLIPFMIALLIYLSPLTFAWQKVLTANWVTLAGGMCYSLYMLHQPLMAVFLNRAVGNEAISGSIPLDFAMKLGLVLLVVFSVSTVYFLLIERPCMKKDWYKNFLRRKPAYQPPGTGRQ